MNDPGRTAPGLSPQPRATVLLTGSELVRGAIDDANGAFLGRELTRLGLEPASVDRRRRPSRGPRGGDARRLQADLCVLSGGLGPTHDDRTIEILALVTGRALVVDASLGAEIEGVARAVAERLGRPYEDWRWACASRRRSPRARVSLGLAGTAPAVLLEHDGRVAVALPGPPGELRRLWPRVLEAGPVRALVARAAPRDQRLLRIYSVPEASVADARRVGRGGAGRARDRRSAPANLEVEVDLFSPPGARRRPPRSPPRSSGSSARTCSPATSVRSRRMCSTRCAGRGGRSRRRNRARAASSRRRSPRFPGRATCSWAARSRTQRGEGGAARRSRRRARAHGAVSEETARAMAAGARERVRRGRGGLRHRNRGPGRRLRGEAGRARPHRGRGPGRRRRRSRSGSRACATRSAAGRRHWPCTKSGVFRLELRRSSETLRPIVESGERLRLFLALPLPSDARERLVAWQAAAFDGVPDVRVVPPENLHITLVFLGERPVEELDAIGSALREAAAAASRPVLSAVRYRETRSVGMVVLDDEDRAAGGSRPIWPSGSSGWASTSPSRGPGCRMSRSSDSGIRRRFGSRLPASARVSPSEVASYTSRLRRNGAQYEIRESVPLGG